MYTLSIEPPLVGEKPAENRSGKLASTAELMIYGPLGAWAWNDPEQPDASKVVKQIRELDPGTGILVRINSDGGVVADGLAIFNALRQHPGRVETRIEGIAYSIASYIAMAGDLVVMADNALVMIHAPWAPGVNGNAEELRQRADELDVMGRALIRAYERNGKVDAKFAEQWVSDGENHYFDAAEAYAVGLIDEIMESQEKRISAHSRGYHMSRKQNQSEQGEPDVTTKEPNAESLVKLSQQEVRAQQQLGQKMELERRNQVGNIFDREPFNGPAFAALRDRCLNDVRMNRARALELAFEALSELPSQAPADMAPSGDTMAGQVWRTPSLDVELGGVSGGRLNIGGGDERRAEGMMKALEIRAGIERDRKVVAKERAGNEFLSQSLIQLMANEMRRAGKKVGGTADAVAHAYVQWASSLALGPGTGTDHLPSLLKNLADRSLIAGWDGAAETWQNWTVPGQLTNYRAATRASTALLNTLNKMLEHEEFKHGKLAEQAQQIQAYMHGIDYTLTAQALVNDDLSALTAAMQNYGEAASATVGDAVFLVLSQTGVGGFGQVMDETSQILFHADHANYVDETAGAPPSEATIKAGRTAMASHKFNDRKVRVLPAYLIHGSGLAPEVGTLLNSQIVVTGQDTTRGERNWVVSLGLEGVEELRIDDWIPEAWMLVANRRSVEVAGLNGPVEPMVEQLPVSNIPGMGMRITMPFGVAALDYRALYMNYGKIV